MTKSDERAVHARSLILKGEQKSVVAERLGYKSVGGMMGSIAMMEHKEKMSGQRFKTKRAMQSPSAAEILKEKKEDKPDILGGEEWQGLRVDVQRNSDGLYVRMESRHLLVSYIGYRKSLNINAKLAHNRQIRLYEAELGVKGALLESIRDLRDMMDRLASLLEGRRDAKDQ